MFDVGFSEMMVIAVVALIVIGPERLPKVARTLGHLVGRLQRYVNDVKADINREMELEELRKFKDQFQDTAQSVDQTIHDEVSKVQSQVQEMGIAATNELAAQSLPSSGEMTGDSNTVVSQVGSLQQSEAALEPRVASKSVS